MLLQKNSFLKRNESKKNIHYLIFIVLISLYSCGTLYHTYKPVNKDVKDEIVSIIGEKQIYGTFDLILAFNNKDTSYEIIKMNVILKYDSTILYPQTFQPPYSPNIKVNTFNDLPVNEKYIKRNYYYYQYIISFNLKKDIFPKEINVELYLELKLKNGIIKIYNISEVLVYKKYRQFFAI